jgi:hypothetical protein
MLKDLDCTIAAAIYIEDICPPVIATTHYYVAVFSEDTILHESSRTLDQKCLLGCSAVYAIKVESGCHIVDQNTTSGG